MYIKPDIFSILSPNPTRKARPNLQIWYRDKILLQFWDGHFKISQKNLQWQFFLFKIRLQL